MKWIFAALVFFATSAHADRDLALYGIQSQHWDCEATLNALRGSKHIGVSLLWNTFGRKLECFSRILKNPHTTTIQLHLINEVCAKNRRCGRYEFLRNNNTRRFELKLLRESPALLARVRRYFIPAAQALAKRRSSALCLVSPSLESMLSPRAAQPLFQLVRELFPECLVVWNPSGASQYRHRRVPGTLYEFHGANPGRVDVANLDGDDVPLAEMPHFLRRTAQAKASFLWRPCMNGIRSKRFVDPRLRLKFCSKAELTALLKVFHPSFG